MPVYVDDARRPLKNMFMSHMLADTTAELLAMADRIGVARRWIQRAGTPDEHFDIAQVSRAKAVAAGAIEVTQRDAVGIRDAKRRGLPVPPVARDLFG